MPAFGPFRQRVRSDLPCGNNSHRGAKDFCLRWMFALGLTIISWLYAPFIFNPYQFKPMYFVPDLKALPRPNLSPLLQYWGPFRWHQTGPRWDLGPRRCYVQQLTS